MILISACLAGIPCKYNGESNEVEKIKKLLEEGKACAVCPEVMGGLSTPRTPSERCGDKVLMQDGTDVTEQFYKGAEEAMKVCRYYKCTKAVLKARSPSCGPDRTYDGSFTHTLGEQNGVFAQMLMDEGIECISEEEYLKENEDECL